MNFNIMRILAVFYALLFFNLYTMELIQINDFNSKFKQIASANNKLKEGVIENNLEKVQEAWKEGADINFKFGYIFDPEADLRAGLRMLQRLGRETYGSAIFQATRARNLDIVKYLFKSGAKTIIEHEGGLEDHNLLFEINPEKNFELFKFLIDSGRMDFTAKIGSEGVSLLHESIMNISLNGVKLLVYHGLDLNDKCFGKQNAIDCTDEMFNGARPGDKERIKPVKLFIDKHAARMKNVKKKSLKDMVQKVNNSIKNKIKFANAFPSDLNNLVADYSFYPDNFEDFFKLSDQEIDELIKIYCEEFEKENSNSECSIM